jgi:hypothetical protein
MGKCCSTPSRSALRRPWQPVMRSRKQRGRRRRRRRPGGSSRCRGGACATHCIAQLLVSQRQPAMCNTVVAWPKLSIGRWLVSMVIVLAGLQEENVKRKAATAAAAKGPAEPAAAKPWWQQVHTSCHR